MNSLMKKLAAHKILFAFLLLGVFVVCGAPVSAHASVTSTIAAIGGAALDVANVFNPYTWGAKLMSMVTYAISFFLTAFISLAGLLLNLILVFSGTLIQSPIIKTGFSITLALMNLGLVVAALFMAVATIAEPVLGNDTYAIKKRLPTLILVAVFANFLLLGAGTVIKFSDGASFYFASQASPGTGGAASYVSFTNKLVGAFNPATLYDTRDLSLLGKLSNIAGSLGDPLQTTLNLLFVTIFELFILIIILLAALMMLIRYVYLGVLLIIAPLALLTSLFPSLSSHWKSWCTKFLHWTMFGPIMMLFLYLTILAAQTRDQYINPISVQVVGGSTSATTALNQQVGRGVGFFVNIAEMVMLLGIAGAGVMAANSFAPKFAKSTMSGAQSLGKNVKNRMVRRGGSAVLGSQGMQNSFSSMQQSGNRVTRWVGRRLQTAGNTSQNAEGEAAKKRRAGLTSQQNVASIGESMKPQDLIAALERARTDNTLSQVKNMDQLLTDANREKFKQLGKLPLFDSLEKESGLSLIKANDAASRAAAINGMDMDKLIDRIHPNDEQINRYGGSAGLVGKDRIAAQKNLVLASLTGNANGETINNALSKLSAKQQVGTFMNNVKAMLASGELKPENITKYAANALYNGATAKNLGITYDKFGLPEPASPANPQAESKNPAKEGRSVAEMQAQLGTSRDQSGARASQSTSPPPAGQSGGASAETGAGGGAAPQTASAPTTGASSQSSGNEQLSDIGKTLREMQQQGVTAEGERTKTTRAAKETAQVVVEQQQLTR